MANDKNYILDAATAEKKLRRMAYEILENNPDEKLLILAGIRESGSVIARRVQEYLKQISDVSTELITISLDKKYPTTVKLSKEMNFDNQVIIVMDDVANSGKTLLYALKPFMEFHPKSIETLVLVERSHKLFPVKPDYVGLSIATTLQEHIYVVEENDKVTGAYLD